MEQMLVQEEDRNNVSGCNNGSHWRDSGREIGMTAREVNQVKEKVRDENMGNKCRQLH